MSRLDVRDLKNEKLPAGRFPGDAPADFRLHVAAKVHKGITEHARQDATVEICGVLVGGWETDAHGPYCLVTDYISCESAASKFAEVTFTHESWAQINKEMDTRFADKRIVGWYHSHPDFGIFLSERDCFIHEHFFSGSGQVAYVIDPVRELEGVFAWRNSKPELMPHFWIGNTICSADASRQQPNAKAAGAAGGGAAAALAGGPQSTEPSYLGALTTVLAWLCLFLLGYLWSGLRSSWERQAINEAMVANFIEFKLLHLGMEDNLTRLRQSMVAITDDLRKLPEITKDTPAEEAEKLTTRKKDLMGYLDRCAAELKAVENTYGFSEGQKAALARVIAEKKAQFEAQQQAAADAAKEGKPAAKEKDEGAKKENDAAKKDAQPARPSPVTPAAPGGVPDKQPAIKGANEKK